MSWTMITWRFDPIDWSRLGWLEARRARRDETKVRGGFWRKIRKCAARIPFAQDAVAAYFAAFDRNTPLKARAALLGALAYFILPADVVPDALPVIGYGDDAAMLFAALRLFSSHITPEHHKAAREALDTLRTEP